MFCKICKENRVSEFVSGGHGGALWVMVECQHKVALKVGESAVWYDKENKIIWEEHEINN